MTHPDILTIEKFGSLYKESVAKRIGKCLYCDETVLDDGEATESRDGIFCNTDCLYEYYEIQKI